MSKAFKRLLDSTKADHWVVGPVERMLMREISDRDQTVIHPSEMAKSDWCLRATYHRLAGDPLVVPIEPAAFALENVWGEGHDIHRRWQRRMWKLGILYGLWKCLHCGLYFERLGVWEMLCEHCGSPALEYAEVPLESEHHLVSGTADGEIYDPQRGQALVEIKSVGKGTLRYEAPVLLKRYTRTAWDENDQEHSWVDYEALWREIRRPFPSHLRQGMIYLFLRGMKRMIFVYEFKPNQQVKEFVVNYQPQIVEPLLDSCRDIKYALEKKRPPSCLTGGCDACRAYEEDNHHGDQEVTKRGAGGGAGGDRGQGRAGAQRSRSAGTPRRGDPASDRRPGRVVRRSVDGSIRTSDAVAGLPERGARARRDR